MQHRGEHHSIFDGGDFIEECCEMGRHILRNRPPALTMNVRTYKLLWE